MNNENKVMIQSLSQEISQKSVLIAQLQGNLYKMATKASKLQKEVNKLKGKKPSKGKVNKNEK